MLLHRLSVRRFYKATNIFSRSQCFRGSILENNTGSLLRCAKSKIFLGTWEFVISWKRVTKKANTGNTSHWTTQGGKHIGTLEHTRTLRHAGTMQNTGTLEYKGIMACRYAKAQGAIERTGTLQKKKRKKMKSTSLRRVST